MSLMPQSYPSREGGSTQVMPRRIPDYPDAFEGWNTVSSAGSLVSVAATALFLYVIYDMLVERPVADANAWAEAGYFADEPSYTTEVGLHSPSLEWTAPSPTPTHAFSVIPVQS